MNVARFARLASALAILVSLTACTDGASFTGPQIQDQVTIAQMSPGTISVGMGSIVTQSYQICAPWGVDPLPEASAENKTIIELADKVSYGKSDAFCSDGRASWWANVTLTGQRTGTTALIVRLMLDSSVRVSTIVKVEFQVGGKV